MRSLAAPHAHTTQPHLCDVLPAILDGLADESEGVRDTALAAGRTLVDLYANTCLPLLLPAVEDGITHDNWRIRQSSVDLLGDLLYKVAGATGRQQVDMTHDEDEGISTEAQGTAIVRALGMERRNEVRLGDGWGAWGPGRWWLWVVASIAVNGSWGVPLPNVTNLFPLTHSLVVPRNLCSHAPLPLGLKHSQQNKRQILARVYMARSDVGFGVRTAALHVWKSIVTNTPRTLGEVMPPLMTLLIQSLAAPGVFCFP